MQTGSYKRKLPLDPPSRQEHPHKRLSLDNLLSWDEEFFANSQGISDRIWASDVDGEPLRFKDTRLELVCPFNHPVPDAPAQVWLARGETGVYAVKLYKPYTDEEAESQAARLSDPKPSLQKVRRDFSPFALETRAYERIRKFCPAPQQSFFRRYHGTIEIPPSPVRRSLVRTSRRQGIVLDVLTLGLEGRHLHSRGVISDCAPHAEILQTELAKMDISSLEKRWYLSVLNDRLRMAMSAHTLGILHGDIKPDCFSLPDSPHDIVLHDFSRGYTFTRERPCAMNGRLRLRSFEHAVEAERRNIRSSVLEMAKSAHLFDHFKRLLGTTEEDTRKVLSSTIPRSLLATELALIVLSVGMTDDGPFFPSLSSILPFLEAASSGRPATWTTTISNHLDQFVSASCSEVKGSSVGLMGCKMASLVASTGIIIEQLSLVYPRQLTTHPAATYTLALLPSAWLENLDTRQFFWTLFCSPSLSRDAGQVRVMDRDQLYAEMKRRH